jgi:hypothetical protein
MIHINKLAKLSVLAFFIGLASMTAKAGSFSQFDNFADYEAVLGGLPLNTQNFEAFAPGDSLDNVELLPGISVTSNLPKVEVLYQELINYCLGLEVLYASKEMPFTILISASLTMQ